MERLKVVFTSPTQCYNISCSSLLPVYSHHLHFYFLLTRITRLKGIRLFKDSKSSAVYFWFIQEYHYRSSVWSSGEGGVGGGSNWSKLYLCLVGHCCVVEQPVRHSLCRSAGLAVTLCTTRLGSNFLTSVARQTCCSKRLPGRFHYVSQAPTCFHCG